MLFVSNGGGIQRQVATSQTQNNRNKKKKKKQRITTNGLERDVMFPFFYSCVLVFVVVAQGYINNNKAFAIGKT